MDVLTLNYKSLLSWILGETHLGMDGLILSIVSMILKIIGNTTLQIITIKSNKKYKIIFLKIKILKKRVWQRTNW